MNKSQRRQEEHDKKTIDTVIRVLEKGYDKVLTNVPYWIHGDSNTHGEMDILAIRGQYVNYYEIKGRHSLSGMRKAVYQTNEFGRNIYNTTNLNNVLPKNPIYRKIYISFDKDNNIIARRLK